MKRIARLQQGRYLYLDALSAKISKVCVRSFFQNVRTWLSDHFSGFKWGILRNVIITNIALV